MKRVRKGTYKVSFCLLIIFLIFFSCISLLKFSNANKVDEINLDSEEHFNEKEVWDFLSNADKDGNNIIETLDSDVDFNKIIVAPENDKEDPNLIVKKNDSKKGVSKATTAKKDVKKYETNETSLGIDVSTWQGNIDWKKVKKSGISFAMIRVGFRRLDSGTIVMDNKFLNNIKGAIANNINVGIYFFSMAKNSSEALEEAKWVTNVIKDYDITYPVAVDIEIFNENRLKGVSYSTMTNNALIFCDYIKKQGYTPMIYSYANAFTKYFDTAKFKGQRIWLAQYNDKVTYKGTYHMWQYTSSGSVPGINGRVDMNVAYFSVTNDVTKASTVNGITNTGSLALVEFKDMEMKTKLNKKVTLRSSPYTTLPNKAGTLDAGTQIVVVGMSENFVKIVYNSDIFYINDTNCFDLILEPVEFDAVDIDVICNKKVSVLYKPYSFLNNNVYGSLNVGDELNVVGVNFNFVEIKVDDSIYYINDVDFYDVINDNIYNGSRGS